MISTVAAQSALLGGGFQGKKNDAQQSLDNLTRWWTNELMLPVLVRLLLDFCAKRDKGSDGV